VLVVHKVILVVVVVVDHRANLLEALHMGLVILLGALHMGLALLLGATLVHRVGHHRRACLRWAGVVGDSLLAVLPALHMALVLVLSFHMGLALHMLDLALVRPFLGALGRRDLSSVVDDRQARRKVGVGLQGMTWLPFRNEIGKTYLSPYFPSLPLLVVIG
jgi:hypothetical protein